MDSHQAVNQAISSIAMGETERAEKLLAKAVSQDRDNERAWALLAELSDCPERAIECLENVLRINPQNHEAACKLLAARPRNHYQAVFEMSEADWRELVGPPTDCLALYRAWSQCQGGGGKSLAITHPKNGLLLALVAAVLVMTLVLSLPALPHSLGRALATLIGRHRVQAQETQAVPPATHTPSAKTAVRSPNAPAALPRGQSSDAPPPATPQPPLNRAFLP